MFRNFIRSVATATLVAVVAGTAKISVSNAVWLYRLRRRSPNGLGAYAWDPVSVFHDKTLWVLFVGVLIAAFSYCLHRFSLRRELPLFLSAAVLSFFVSGAVMLLLVGVAARASPPVPDRFRIFLLFGFFAATYVGDFAFVAAVAGAFWIGRRTRQLRSTKRLLLESAAAGALLGAIFPLYYHAMFYHAMDTQPVETGFAMFAELFCAIFGCFCAVLFALRFRRRLLPLKLNNA
ncbi:MAG: hypothetical protein JO187_00780 [Acidobacteria bacterium]|nr:hypothetical protein [Acidobacteriota bacterium]